METYIYHTDNILVITAIGPLQLAAITGAESLLGDSALVTLTPPDKIPQKHRR